MRGTDSVAVPPHPDCCAIRPLPMGEVKYAPHRIRFQILERPRRRGRFHLHCKWRRSPAQQWRLPWAGVFDHHPRQPKAGDQKRNAVGEVAISSSKRRSGFSRTCATRRPSTAQKTTSGRTALWKALTENGLTLAVGLRRAWRIGREPRRRLRTAERGGPLRGSRAAGRNDARRLAVVPGWNRFTGRRDVDRAGAAEGQDHAERGRHA